MGHEIKVPAENYVYLITVIDRSPQLELATFQEAKGSGALSELLTQTLEPFYTEVRGQHEDLFKKDGGGWKPFADVKREVTELWLDQRLKEIKTAADQNLKEKSPTTLIPDLAASLRFAAWAGKVKSSPNKEVFLADKSLSEVDSNKLPPKAAWIEQFKWDKEDKSITRAVRDEVYEKEKLFALKAGETSPLLTPPNGDLSFIYVKERKVQPDPNLLANQTVGIRNLIGAEAERSYMKRVLADIKSKGAISFDFLQVEPEMINP